MRTYFLRYENIDSMCEQEVEFQAICDDQAKTLQSRFVEDGITVWSELVDSHGTVISD